MCPAPVIVYIVIININWSKTKQENLKKWLKTTLCRKNYAKSIKKLVCSELEGKIRKLNHNPKTRLIIVSYD